MMNNAQLATASLDDIVFDGRNKAYGAYVLRAEYDRHVTRALIIASALFLLLISFPIVARMLDKKTESGLKRHVVLKPIDITPPDAPVIVPPAPKEVVEVKAAVPRPTLQFTPPKVVSDPQATSDDVPEQTALARTDPGTETISGPTTTEPIIEEAPVINKPTEGVVAPSVYTYVEQMPKLPGDMSIVGAIQKAVKYPTIDVRNGVEGKVFASFTVNPQGEIVDVKIVKGLSATLDEETIRAIRTLPKFIPGKQNGREVSVSFTVPVTYKIQ